MTPKAAFQKLIDENPGTTEAQLRKAWMEFLLRPENLDEVRAALTEIGDDCHG